MQNIPDRLRRTAMYFMRVRQKLVLPCADWYKSEATGCDINSNTLRAGLVAFEKIKEQPDLLDSPPSSATPCRPEWLDLLADDIEFTARQPVFAKNLRDRFTGMRTAAGLVDKLERMGDTAPNRWWACYGNLGDVLKDTAQYCLRLAGTLATPAQDDDPSSKALTPGEQAFFDLLNDEGQTGRDLAATLARQGIKSITPAEISKMSKRPHLVARGVRNRKGAGYYKITPI